MRTCGCALLVTFDQQRETAMAVMEIARIRQAQQFGRALVVPSRFTREGVKVSTRQYTDADGDLWLEEITLEVPNG